MNDPQVGSVLPVYLPQELVRGVVEEVRDNGEIVVALTVTPPFLGNVHRYSFGDRVTCVRSTNRLSGYPWEAVRK